MHPTLKNDLTNLDSRLDSVLQKGLQYLAQLDDIPTSLPSFDYQTKSLEAGVGMDHVLSEFAQRFEKLMIASSGPRYWGFVTGGTTPAALAGDMLTSFYDQNTQTNKGHGDLSAVVELETIQLLLQLFELPADQFAGGFVTGATMSNFTCLATARQWIGKQQGIDIAKDGVQTPIKILTAVPHSSSIKSLAMLGLGSRNILTIDTMEGNREAIDTQKLEAQIELLDGTPFILISSGGTVNTVDFDDMQAISRLKEKHNFWWHIDAAFGGFAVLSPDHRHLLQGWENADSITMDGHKWLNVPYESAFFFTRKEHSKIQVEAFQNSNAPYLGDPTENFSFLNFLPENSRRFKALPTWFTLKAYGREGYAEIVNRNIRLAHQLGEFIEQSEELVLLAPVRVNTVCFSLNQDYNDQVTSFLNELNNRGKVFMTPTNYKGKSGIRAALVNWRTSEKDLEIVINELQEVLQSLKTTSC